LLKITVDTTAKFDPGHQKVRARSNPDLRQHIVFGSAFKRFNSQILLDAVEEHFYLPARFVDIGNGFDRQMKVIG